MPFSGEGVLMKNIAYNKKWESPQKTLVRISRTRLCLTDNINWPM